MTDGVNLLPSPQEQSPRCHERHIEGRIDGEAILLEDLPPCRKRFGVAMPRRRRIDRRATEKDRVGMTADVRNRGAPLFRSQMRQDLLTDDQVVPFPDVVRNRAPPAIPPD